MRLSQYLAADRLVVPLGAETLQDAADVLVQRLAATGAVASVPALRERVADERPEDIVAMGDRAFLLHYRTDAVTDLLVALGTSPRPICRTLGDGDEQCARILLMVVAPPRLAGPYLRVLGAFARFLSKPERVDTVLAQNSAEALAALPALAEYAVPAQVTVRDVMTQRPRTVHPDGALREAARDMVSAGVGGLPVVDQDGRVVGMLGERELLQHLLTNYLQGGTTPAGRPTPPAGMGRRAVRDVMTRQVLCVSPDQPLAEVASVMANKDVDRVPVVKEGQLVGFLTRGDIVRKLLGT